MKKRVVPTVALLMILAIILINSKVNTKEILLGDEKPMQYITAFAYKGQDASYETNCTGWVLEVFERVGIDVNEMSCMETTKENL